MGRKLEQNEHIPTPFYRVVPKPSRYRFELWLIATPGHAVTIADFGNTESAESYAIERFLRDNQDPKLQALGALPGLVLHGIYYAPGEDLEPTPKCDTLPS